MKRVRKRFMILPDLLREAEEYAAATNRGFGELACEAIAQHMARYPLKREKGFRTWQKEVDARLFNLEGKTQQRYTQVPQAEDSKGVRE